MYTRNNLSRPVGASLLTLLLATSGACGGGNPLGPGFEQDLHGGVEGPFASHGRGIEPVPFRGTLVTTQQVIDSPPLAGCQISATNFFRGELTRLGRFLGQGNVCAFNVQFGVQNPPFNLGGGPPPYMVSDFVTVHVYTAANGDQLQITGQGVRVQSLTDGTSSFMGQGVIDGGTGRFEGASGQFEVVGAGGKVRYDGWILYDASNRAGN